MQASVSKLAKEFFEVIDEAIGPFDRPIQFRPFPFDAGGALNFLTVDLNRNPRVTYVSWDLFGNPLQKRGTLGRYELLAVSDDEHWCLDILTKIGRESLRVVFEPGDTLDLAAWVDRQAAIQGIVFEEALRVELPNATQPEKAGVLRCIGITRAELEFAKKYGVPALVECLKISGVYPATITSRASVSLSG